MRNNCNIDISVRECAYEKGYDLEAFREAVEEAKSSTEMVNFNDAKLWLLDQFDNPYTAGKPFIGYVSVFDNGIRFILYNAVRVIYGSRRAQERREIMQTYFSDDDLMAGIRALLCDVAPDELPENIDNYTDGIISIYGLTGAVDHVIDQVLQAGGY